MKLKLAFALFPLMLLGAPLYAESLCVQCFDAAKAELKKCLEEAISQEDKISCEEKKEARAKSCEDGECQIERAQSDSKPESSSEKK
jgi:hypothetical protein